MKIFLSIGTGPGMGLATAARFAREGYHVVLAARNEQKLEQMAATLRAQGHAASVAAVDVADATSLAKAISGTESKIGPVDTVHYNAAVLHPTSIDSLDTEGFAHDLSVNIGGAYAAIRAILPFMMQRAEGTILLTGGGFGLQPSPEFIAMSVGKAGLRALALGLFEDLKKRGIHIATVTVCANIEAGSKASDAVASAFFELRNQRMESWTAEKTFTL